MEGIEGMFLAHAFSAEKLYSKTIDAAVLAILLAEFALTVSGDPPSFESDKFLKECVALSPPDQQRIVLT